MKILISLVLGLFGLLSVNVFAEVTPQTIKPFKSICISNHETGFNWSNGEWMPAKFKTQKYILEKIDYEKEINASNSTERPFLCSAPKVQKIDEGSDLVTACYAISEFGGPPRTNLDARDCIEGFRFGNIQMIQCRGIGNFKPNGLFVKLPSQTSMDLSSDREKNKDSISLAVGTCGVL